MTDQEVARLSNGALISYRLEQLEKRVWRIELLLISIASMMAMVVVTYVLTAVGLPAP